MSIEHDIGDIIEWLWANDIGCTRMKGIVTKVDYNYLSYTGIHCVKYMVLADEEFRGDKFDTYCVDQEQTFSRRP